MHVALTLRTAALGAITLTVALGMISNLLFVAAFQFRLDWLFEPALAVTAGAASAELLKWAAITDLFSYYLPTAVVAIALWVALRAEGEVIAGLATIAALAYVIAGSIGAGALAMGGSLLLREHAAPGADQAAIGVAFATLIEVVWRGIWQLIDLVFVGTWMLGIARLIRRFQPRFAMLTLVVGLLALTIAAFSVLGLALGRDVALGLLFAALAAWSIWLGMLLWRRSTPFESL